MKGYLLLEDGSFLFGEVIGELKNLLGEMLLNDQGNITVHCKLTDKYGLIVNTSNRAEGNIVLSDVDFESLKSKIGNNKKLQGKIVTDSLPMEYHVYDLKTFIPLGVY